MPVVVQDPHREAPLTLHRCADGVLRLFSGDLTHSPYGLRRDPLYCWDVDPETFAVSDRRTVFDSVAQGLFADAAQPQRSTCFAYVLPHQGGRVQYAAMRLLAFAYEGGQVAGAPELTDEMLARHGMYITRIHYDRDYPPRWEFGAE